LVLDDVAVLESDFHISHLERQRGSRDVEEGHAGHAELLLNQRLDFADVASGDSTATISCLVSPGQRDLEIVPLGEEDLAVAGQLPQDSLRLVLPLPAQRQLLGLGVRHRRRVVARHIGTARADEQGQAGVDE